MDNNLFEAVKEAVTTKAAAIQYGLTVNQNGMAICPFHSDQSPSLKLNDDYYFCFGCGASGDVIDFVAQLFQITNYEAAKKLADDFGVQYSSGRNHRAEKAPLNKRPISVLKEIARQRDNYTFRILQEYHHLLMNWEKELNPKNKDERIDPRYLEALQKKEYVEYLIDQLIAGSDEEKAALCSERNPDIREFAHRLAAHKKKEILNDN